MDIRQKPWGEEIVYIDEPEYAMKLLKIKKTEHTSLHYHPTKKESFFLLAGKVSIEIKHGCSSFHPLKVGEVYHIVPKTTHSIHAIEDSIIIEISTQPKDETVRIQNEPNKENDN